MSSMPPWPHVSSRATATTRWPPQTSMTVGPGAAILPAPTATSHELRTHRDDLAVIVRDSLAPPIRHQREQHELQRINTILEGHDDRTGQGD